MASISTASMLNTAFFNVLAGVGNPFENIAAPAPAQPAPKDLGGVLKNLESGDRTKEMVERMDRVPRQPEGMEITGFFTIPAGANGTGPVYYSNATDAVAWGSTAIANLNIRGGV